MHGFLVHALDYGYAPFRSPARLRAYERSVKRAAHARVQKLFKVHGRVHALLKAHERVHVRLAAHAPAHAPQNVHRPAHTPRKGHTPAHAPSRGVWAGPYPGAYPVQPEAQNSTVQE